MSQKLILSKRLYFLTIVKGIDRNRFKHYYKGDNVKMGVKENNYWENVRSNLKKGETVCIRHETWRVAYFMEQLDMTIEQARDSIETIELDIENVKDGEWDIFGDFTLTIIPKLKLDLKPFDLFTWLPFGVQYDKTNETVAYMRWLMIEGCHIEKDGDELLPIVYIDKEAYTDSEYHIITNYLEYLGLEAEDLEK